MIKIGPNYYMRKHIRKALRDANAAFIVRACNSHAKLLSFVETIARMKTEHEFGDDAPPSEDWICTLNDLIVQARKQIKFVR
jgi:hypothetical protein